MNLPWHHSSSTQAGEPVEQPGPRNRMHRPSPGPDTYRPRYFTLPHTSRDGMEDDSDEQ